jgi:aminoglycoside phosphotransferase (APT) family kinase protein
LSIGPITVERVNGYLEARLPGFRGWTAQRVDAVAGGFSKTTFIVTMAAPGTTVDWVLRRDLGFQPNLSTVADEAPLLAALENRSVLAPRLLWSEPDPAFFGAPVIAMARLPGSADASIWERDAAQAKSVVEQAAVLLGRIHHIPIAEMPDRKTRVPGTRGETPRELVAHLIQTWRSMRLPPNPLMETLLVWLDRNAPATFGPPVLLHGDFGSHNLLVHDGKITGLLDWEFSHVGDPHEDLMSLKPFLEGITDWGEFIALYESASGLETNAKLERYYAVVVAVRIMLGMFRISDGIGKGEPHIDSKLAYIARSYTTTYLIDIAGMVAAPLSR